MDTIVDFFVRNIVFVVVIIGVLISVFSTGTKKKERGGGSKMPPFSGRGDSGTPLFDSEPPPVARENRPTASSVGRRAVTPAEEHPAWVSLAEPSYHTSGERGVMAVSAAELAVSSAAVEPNRSSQMNGLRLNKHTVVQGVLWGEILGPPRAKKKHIR